MMPAAFFCRDWALPAVMGEIELYRKSIKAFIGSERLKKAGRSEPAIEQEFAIPFCSEDWRLGHIGVRAVQCNESFPDFFHGRGLRRHIAHNAAFPHVLAADFK